MPTPFSCSLRSLDADGFRRPAWSLFLVGAVGAVGLGWLCFARITRYETTATARLEAASAPHPIAAPVAGRVVASHLVLGARVERGTVLLELDDETERLRLNEAIARRDSFASQLGALRGQTRAEEGAWPDQRRTAALGTDEARAQLREAEAAAQFAESEAARLQRLGEGGLLSTSDLLRAGTEATKQRAIAAARSLTVARLESEERSLRGSHEVRLAQVTRDTAALAGEVAASTAAIHRYEHEIALRRICAPAAGEVGGVADLPAGAFVAEGEKIGAIVPAGPLRIVAQFAPSTGLGRLRANQPGRLRLDGFPWAQFGSVPAVVTRVASEPRDGAIRVELAIDAGRSPHLPLQHGLTGILEVEVERVTPARLVLRAAGALLTAPRPAAAPAGLAPP